MIFLCWQKVNSSAIVGLDAVPVEVEVDIASQGLPNFQKVGVQCQNLKSLPQYEAQHLKQTGDASKV